MSKRVSILGAATLAAVLLVTGCGGGSTERVDRIVLVTVDGLIPAEISLYGGELSMPHLEELAASGAAWDDVWTAVPMTRPAAASYLTGLAPDRHAVRDDFLTSLDPEHATLARLLSEAGYETAAFPWSSYVGFQSGLLDDFGVVDDAPFGLFHPGRWVPTVPAPELSNGNFASWVETLEEDGSFFAWVHLAHPLRAQLLDPPLDEADGITERIHEQALERGDDYPSAVAAVDGALGAIVAALQAREWFDETLLVVVGTSGDIGGSDAADDDLFGSGFSLHEGALQVPLVVHPPSGLSLADPERPVWGLDVPATVADLAGVTLTAEAEGRSLRNEPDPAREMLAFSWATADQMAWPALRAARAGAVKVIEGIDGTSVVTLDDGEAAADVVDRLTASLATRADPEMPKVELDAVLPLLERRGIEIEPMTPERRQRLEPEQRRELVKFLTRARRAAHRAPEPTVALRLFRRAWNVDNDNPGILFDRGQILVLSRHEEGPGVMNRAVRLYPQDPDALHWYAHSIWNDSLDDAGTLLEAVLPYKPADGDVLYDLACLRSLEEDLDGAQDYLAAAIDAGYRFWQHMETDTDLRNLRESGRFAEVVAEYGR